jgi:hypothetical protein
VVIPTPVAATRIDRIVLRSDWTAQTVRIYRIEGVEGAGAPARETTEGTLYDLLLYRVSIVITTGAITLTDERDYVHPPAPVYRRQGGAAGNWDTAGTDNYTPGRSFIQCGAAEAVVAPGAATGTVTVTYPAAYGFDPIAQVQSLVTHAAWIILGVNPQYWVVEAGPNDMIVTVHLDGVLAGGGNLAFNWVTYGPEV